MQGRVGLGAAVEACCGLAGRGGVRLGGVRQGKVWRSRLGLVRQGEARPGGRGI